MKKQIMLILLFIISNSLLFSQTSNKNKSDLPPDLSYKLKLIDYYMKNNRFDLAATYIDSALAESVRKDSLYYLKGLAFKNLKDWERATDSFSLALIHAENEQFIPIVKNEFKHALDNLSPMAAIEKISSIIGSLENSEIQMHFLLIIAQIYEEHTLYEEAIDVYKTILNDINDEDKVELNLKLATNYLFLKDFKDALDILEPIVAMNDSIYIEDALFFYYIANYSLKNFDISKSAILRLYLDYPHHQNRTEIIKGLSKVYEQEGQYLLSWFLMNELYNISSQAQKFKIGQDISRIKKMLVQDTLSIDQFKDFKPVFEEIEDVE